MISLKIGSNSLIVYISLILFSGCGATKTAQYSNFLSSQPYILEKGDNVCDFGGMVLYFGNDINGDGTLNVDERIPSKTQYGCNGVQGNSSIISSVATSNQCYDITTGIDTNNDGTIDKDINTITVCDGEDGKNGTDGKDSTNNGTDGLNASSDLPLGAIQWLTDTSHIVRLTDPVSFYYFGAANREAREFLCNTKILTTTDYPFLAVAGRDLTITVNAGYSYYADFATRNTSSLEAHQIGTGLYINGSARPVNDWGDLYGIDVTGNNENWSDAFVYNLVTDGNDLEVKGCFIMGSNPLVLSRSDILTVESATYLIKFDGKF